MRLDELGLEDIQSIPHGGRVEPRELRKLVHGQRGAGDLPVRRAALTWNLAQLAVSRYGFRPCGQRG